MLLMLGWGSLIFILVLIYGLALENLLARFTGGEGASARSLLMTWCLGLALVTTLASLLSLVLPLSAAALAILLLGAVLMGVVGWRLNWLAGLRRLLLPTRLPALVWVLAALVLVSVLEIATHRGDNPDSGIYHMQAIRWMETYPVVPGLGNLHTRFAYNSAWLVVNAIFSLAFTIGQSFHILPAVVYLVFLWQGLISAARLFNEQRHLSDWIAVAFIPLSFYALAGEVASPGTDFPAILLYWSMLLGGMRLVEQARSGLLRASLILLGVFLMTIKLSTLAAMLIALWAGWGLFTQRSRRRLLWLAIGAGVIILLPWLVRNILLSGYIIYPLTFTALPGLEWLIPPELVRDDALAILTWGRLPNMDVDMVATMTLRDWVPIWFSDQTRNRQLLLVALVVAPPLLALGLWLLRGNQAGVWQQVKPYLVMIAVSYVGVLYWFLSAPLFRYGIGVVLAALLLALLPMWVVIDRAANRWRWLLTALLVVLCLYQSSLLTRSFEAETFASRLVLPADVIRLRTSPCEFGDFSAFCAEEYGECWYEPFPCVPRSSPNVFRRGADDSDGFFWRELAQ